LPQLNNQTPGVLHAVPMIDKDGRNTVVVIAKLSYELDHRGLLAAAEKQEEIIFADEFVGEPGKSEMRVPSDLVDYKPASDVIVVRPEENSHPKGLRRVKLEVGGLRKARWVWKKWKFGPVRRNRRSRRRYAGTYNQSWIENRMPLLPEDFDPRHNLAAPRDQVFHGYLKGNEHVRLTNHYSRRVVEYDLPGRVVIVGGNVMSHYFTEVAVLDTLLIWPDRPRITLVWRHSIPCRVKTEEVRNINIYLVQLRTARDLYGRP
jgi:hypothetical protein